jgi:hypothetical protein
MGTLSYTDPDVGDVRLSNVEVSARGHTSAARANAGSQTEAEIPRDERPTASSLFDGVTTVKIGTHCGDGPTRCCRQADRRRARRPGSVRRLEAARAFAEGTACRISYVNVKTVTTARAAAGPAGRPTVVGMPCSSKTSTR